MAAWMLHGASVGRKLCVFPCRVAAGGYLLRVSIYSLLHLMISLPFWTICVNFNSFSFRKKWMLLLRMLTTWLNLSFYTAKKYLKFFETSNWFAQSGIGGYPWPGRWCYAGIWWNGWTAEQSLAARHPKHSQANARQNWFDHIHYDVNLAALSLPPSKDCVATVLKNLPISAAGPDGIPFGLYAALKDLALPIFVHCLQLYLTAQVKHLLPSIMLFSFVCLRNLALIWAMESMHAGLVILDHCPLWMLQTVSSQIVYWNIWRLFYRRTFAMRNVVFWKTDTCFKTSWNLITVHFGQVRCTLKRLSCCLISVLLFLLFVRIPFCHCGFPAEVLHAIQCFYQDNNKHWLKHNYMGKRSLLFAYKVVFVKVVRSAHCFFSLATDSLLRKLQSVMPTELDIVCWWYCRNLFWLVEIHPFLECFACWVWRSIPSIEPEHCEDCISLHCTGVARRSCSWTTTAQQVRTKHPRTGLAGARRMQVL